jgi:hypothetical protein
VRGAVAERRLQRVAHLPLGGERATDKRRRTSPRSSGSGAGAARRYPATGSAPARRGRRHSPCAYAWARSLPVRSAGRRGCRRALPKGTWPLAEPA